MAEAAASATAETPVRSFLRSSAAAAETVSVILVPVSPSGTGKTFNSLMDCLLLSRASYAQRSISFSSAPPM